MDSNPLILDGYQDVTELLRLVVQLPADTVYDDVTISVNNRFAGIVSVKQIVVSQLNHYDFQVVEL
jgi:hypothetical protein